MSKFTIPQQTNIETTPTPVKKESTPTAKSNEATGISVPMARTKKEMFVDAAKNSPSTDGKGRPLSLTGWVIKACEEKMERDQELSDEIAKIRARAQ